MPDLLINIDDIKQFRPVSVEQKRADAYILEAQENDLRPVLNDALYRDFINKVFDSGSGDYAKYQELLNGTTYTINSQTVDFPGVKPMLCYFALARIVMNNQINITSYSIVQKNIDQSTPVENSTIKMLVTELRSVAISYQNRLQDFLREKQATYPLYNTLRTLDNNQTGLKFFKG